MRLGIVGAGCVGKAMARAFVEHVDEVRVHDCDPKKSTHNLHAAIDSNLVFVCLPSPQKKDSLECYTGYIETFFAGVRDTPTNFVLKSTVPVGFTRQMAERFKLPNLVHSPEFLTARTSITDAHLPARNIIGYTDFVPSAENTDQHPIRELYERRFPGTPLILCSSDESELIKLATNGAFATKIGYFNEVRAFSDSLELNWDVVLAGILADGRIAHSHTKVPGNDGKFGFGPDTPQNCLKKDLASFVHQIEESGSLTLLNDEQAGRVGYGTAPSICRAVMERNRLDRERTA